MRTAFLLSLLAAVHASTGFAVAVPAAAQGPQKPLTAAEVCALALDPPGLAAGNYDQACAALLDAMAAEPDGPFAPLLASRAASWLDRTADRIALLERAVKILDDPRSPGRLAARLGAFRSELALRRGNENALLRAGDYFPGFVARAAVIGPVGDAVPSPLSQVYAPEKGLGLEASTRGLGFHRTASWRPVARRPFEMYFDLSNFGDAAGGVRYVKAQIRAVKPMQAYLQILAPGSFAAWWNGSEVARLDLTTEPRQPVRPAPIVLRPGWNAVLVKTEVQSGAWLAVAVVDGEGRHLDGLEEEPALVDRAIAPAAELEPPAPFSLLEDRLTVALAEATDPAAKVSIEAMLGVVLLSLDRPSQGLAALRRAAAAAPDSVAAAPVNVAVQFALAEGTLWARYLPETDVKNRARDAADKVLAVNGKHVPALLMRAELLSRDDRMEEALTALDAAAAASPDCHLVASARANVFGKLEWPSEQRRAVEEWAVKAPNSEAARFALAREFREVGDAAREMRELDAAAALSAFDGNVSQRRAELWSLKSETARSIAERHKWVRLYQRPQDKLNYAKALDAAGRKSEALEIYTELRETYPNDPERALELARFARTANPEVDTRAAFDAVLQEAPGNAEARTWLREVGGGYSGDEFFARHRPDAVKAIADYKPSPDHEKAPDVLVLDYQAERVLPDGSSELEIVSVHRVNDQRGIDKHGSAEFQGDLVDIRVVHADGTYDEPTPAKGDFALPNLKAGDFIVVRSRVLDASSPGERVLRGKFSFQSQENPFLFSQYVLALPRGGALRLVEKNFDGDHDVQETDQEVVHTFTKKDSPRVLPEPMAPSSDLFLPWVRAGESSTPSELNRAYRAGLYRGMEVTEEVKAAAADAVVKAKAKTDLEKATALYAYCNDTLLQRGAGTATRSLLEKKGNALSLYGALLRAESIPFELGIARGVPREGDDEPVPYFLDAQRYRQPLVKILPRDGGKPVWVDVSQRLQPFGELTSNLSDSEVFVLSDGEPRVEELPRLPDAESSQGEIETTAELRGGQAARVSVKLTIRNRSAWFFREQVRNATADIRKTIAAQVSNSLVQGIELEKFEFPNLDNSQAPLVILFEGTVKNFLRDGAAGLETPLLLQPIPLAKQYAGRSKRKLPLRFPTVQYFRETMRIIPGEGQAFGEIPASAKKAKFTTEYNLDIKSAGGALEVVRVLRTTPGTIAPADFAAFLGLCREVEELDQTKVPVKSTVKPDSSPAPESRENGR